MSNTILQIPKFVQKWQFGPKWSDPKNRNRSQKWQKLLVDALTGGKTMDLSSATAFTFRDALANQIRVSSWPFGKNKSGRSIENPDLVQKCQIWCFRKNINLLCKSKN